MTYDEAKKRIIIKWLFGGLIAFAASLSSTVSVLKMFYFGLDNGAQLSSSIALSIKRMIYFFYEKSKFLEFFWRNSPTPEMKELLSNSNILFVIIYLLIFAGVALVGSAGSLSERLAKIDEEIDDQLIRESVNGRGSRKRQEIQEQVSVPRISWIAQFHALYLAPLVVGLLVAFIAKIAGLV